MRIAIFSDSWYPYVSGVVRSIEIFMGELHRQNHQAFLFAPSRLPAGNQEGFHRVFSLPAPGNPDFRLALPLSGGLGRLLKKMSVDILHCHSPFMMGRAGMFWSRRLGLPLVFTHHTLYDLYSHYAGPLAKPAANNLTRYVRGFSNRCDLVITPTKIVAKKLAAQGVTAPMEAVPTGVVPEEFREGDDTWLHRNLGLAKEDTVILCVARLGVEKNLFLLLKSFSLIQKRFPRSLLVVVGLGPLGLKLKKFAGELGLSERFHLLDRVLSREEMVGCYASADLFLYPSVTETQGIIINEAQAAGLPVVAVGAYGVAEMVTDGVDGILTEPEPESLAEAAVRILSDERLRARLAGGALEAARLITAGETTMRLVRAYQRTVQLHKKGGRNSG